MVEFGGCRALPAIPVIDVFMLFAENEVNALLARFYPFSGIEGWAMIYGSYPESLYSALVRGPARTGAKADPVLFSGFDWYEVTRACERF